MDNHLNAVKLDRLINHINDEGRVTPTTVAGLVKAKPENVKFLRDYVQGAAERLKRPDILTEFDAAVAETLKASEAPAGAPEIAVKLPVNPETEIGSVPETLLGNTADAPVTIAPTKTDAVATPVGPVRSSSQAHGGTNSFRYIYTGPDGIARTLVEIHRKGNNVVLTDAPTDEIVQVQLRGQTVDLNMTQLRQRPAGEEFTTSAGVFTVATLLVIADAAKPG